MKKQLSDLGYKSKLALIEHLKEIVTPERFSLFERTIEQRTKYITVVLEDIYQPHNASAVLRSCDCFGIQDVHIIENKNKYTINPDVALGSSKWLTLNKYGKKENNTIATINTLKKDGYRIIATTPHTNDVTLEEFDISKGKFALLFGSEQPGLTKAALDRADEYIKIPMYGFTESFNISVSAAISLHTLSHKLRQTNIPFSLSQEEKTDIMLAWLGKSIKAYDLIVKQFLNPE